jgi:hypothetical protein
MDDFSGMYFRHVLGTAADNMRISLIVYKTAYTSGTIPWPFRMPIRFETICIGGNFNVDDTVPLFGSTLTLPPGLMYHSSVAWIMVFNLLVALTDNCNNNAGPAATANNNNNNMVGLPVKDMPLLLKDLPMRSVHDQWKERAEDIARHFALGVTSSRRCKPPPMNRRLGLLPGTISGPSIEIPKPNRART